MKALFRIGALTLLLFPVLASAQEPQPQHPLAGIWRGAMIEGIGEDGDVSVDLRVEGDVVTGPLSTRQIGDLSIRNGSVTANSVQFTSADPTNPSVSLVWSGQLTGANELAVSVVVEGGDGPAREFVMTKRLPVPGGGN